MTTKHPNRPTGFQRRHPLLTWMERALKQGRAVMRDSDGRPMKLKRKGRP